MACILEQPSAAVRALGEADDKIERLEEQVRLEKANARREKERRVEDGWKLFDLVQTVTGQLPYLRSANYEDSNDAADVLERRVQDIEQAIRRGK